MLQFKSINLNYAFTFEYQGIFLKLRLVEKVMLIVMKQKNVKKNTIQLKMQSNSWRRSKQKLVGSQIYETVYIFRFTHASYNACDCCVSNNYIDTHKSPILTIHLRVHLFNKYLLSGTVLLMWIQQWQKKKKRHFSHKPWIHNLVQWHTLNKSHKSKFILWKRDERENCIILWEHKFFLKINVFKETKEDFFKYVMIALFCCCFKEFIR